MLYKKKWSRWMAWLILMVMIISSLSLPVLAENAAADFLEIQSEASISVTETVYGEQGTAPVQIPTSDEVSQTPESITITSPTNNANILNARNNRNGAELELVAEIIDTEGNPIEAEEGVKWYYKTSTSTMDIEGKDPIIIAESAGTQLTYVLSDVAINWMYQAGFVRIYAEYGEEDEKVVSSGITRATSLFKSVTVDKEEVKQGETITVTAITPEQYAGETVNFTLKKGNTVVKEEGENITLSGELTASEGQATVELSYTVAADLAPGEYSFHSFASAPTPEVIFTITEGTQIPQTPESITITSPTNNANILNARNNRNGAELELVAEITDTEGNPIETEEGVKWYYKTSTSTMDIEGKDPIIIAESAGTQLTYAPSDIEIDWDYNAGYIKIYAEYGTEEEILVSQGIILPISLFKDITADKATVNPEEILTITATAPLQYAGETINLTLKKGDNPVEIEGEKITLSGILIASEEKSAVELDYTLPSALEPGEYSLHSHVSEATPEIVFALQQQENINFEITFVDHEYNVHEDGYAVYLHRQPVTARIVITDNEGQVLDLEENIDKIRFYYHSRLQDRSLTERVYITDYQLKADKITFTPQIAETGQLGMQFSGAQYINFLFVEYGDDESGWQNSDKLFSRYENGNYNTYYGPVFIVIPIELGSLIAEPSQQPFNSQGMAIDFSYQVTPGTTFSNPKGASGVSLHKAPDSNAYIDMGGAGTARVSILNGELDESYLVMGTLELSAELIAGAGIEGGTRFLQFASGNRGVNIPYWFIESKGITILQDPPKDLYNHGDTVNFTATAIDENGQPVTSGIHWYYTITPDGEKIGDLGNDATQLNVQLDMLEGVDETTGLQRIYIYGQYDGHLSNPVEIDIQTIVDVEVSERTGNNPQDNDVPIQVSTSPALNGYEITASLLKEDGEPLADSDGKPIIALGTVAENQASFILTIPADTTPGDHQIQVGYGENQYTFPYSLFGEGEEPQLILTLPTENSFFRQNEMVQVNAQVTDSFGQPIESDIIWYYYKGEAVEENRINLGTGGSSYSFSLTDQDLGGLVEGDFYHQILIGAEYTDSNTNKTGTAVPLPIQVDFIRDMQVNLLRTSSGFSYDAYIETIFDRDLASQLQGLPITISLSQDKGGEPLNFKGEAMVYHHNNPEIGNHSGSVSKPNCSSIKSILNIPEGLPAGEYYLTVKMGERSQYALPYTVFGNTDALVKDAIDRTVQYLNRIVKNEGYILDDWDAIALAWAGEDLSNSKWQDRQGRDYAYWKAVKISSGDWGYSTGNNPRPTDIERSILGIVASGHDPRDFAGINVIEMMVNTLEAYNYDFEGGDNAHMWGIIAMHAAGADASDGYDAASEERLVTTFAQRVVDKSGELDFGSFGVDMAGMGMNALGPYRGRFPVANEAYLILREDVRNRITPLGRYRSSGYNPESIVTVVQGLTSGGEDPLMKDFSNVNGNLLSMILQAQDEANGSFSHGSLMKNYMATQQSLMALTDIKHKESMYKGIPKKDLPPYEIKIPSILSVVLEETSVQKGEAIKLEVTVNTMLIGDNTTVNAELVTMKDLVDDVGQEITPVLGIASVTAKTKNNKAELTLDIPDTLEIGDYHVYVTMEGGHIATSLFKVREWQPGPGPVDPKDPVEGTVSAYIRVEGYNRTLVPKQMVNTTNFDLTPYLSKGTGSTATPSEGWDPDRLTKPTALHQLITALQQNGISQHDIQDYGWSLYVAMIGGDREFDYRKTSGWMYRVNDWMPNYGSQAHILKDGEDILWYFGAYGSDTWYTKLNGDKSSVATGEKVIFTLTGMNTDMDTGAEKREPLKDAIIYVNGKPYEMEGKEVKTDQEGKATLTFYEAGSYSISAERFSGEGIRNIIRPEPVTISVSGSSIVPSGGAAQINNPVYKELYDTILVSTTDKEIIDAVKKTLDIYKESIEKISTQADIENIFKDIQDILKVYQAAAERIQSQENASELITKSAELIEALTETLTKLSQITDKQKLAQNTVKTLEIVNTLIQKIQKETLLDQAAEESITAAGKLIRNIGTKNSKAVESAAIQIAKTIIEKFSTYELTEKAVNLIKEKIIAKATIDRLEEMAEKTIKKIEQMEKILKENGIQSSLTKEMIIQITARESQETELQLDQELLQRAAAAGIQKITLKTEQVSFHLTENTFGEVAAGETITLTAQKIELKDLPIAARSAIPKDSIILDLNAQIGNQTIKSFAEAIEVTLPYTGEVEEDKEVKVFLLKEDGSLALIGGTYHPLTKTITFSTSHFSKYLAMQTEETIQQTEEAQAVMKQNYFTDLADYDWAVEAIETMAGKGIISGRRAGIFDPGGNITRAEFAALITKLTNHEEVIAQAIGFEDIASDAWYYEAVTKAYRAGLIKGRNHNEFDPNGAITREEMAVIIAKVLKKETTDTSVLNNFKDKEEMAPWAKEAIVLCHQKGIIKGMGDGNFAPKEKTNRAQTAVMLYKLYNLIQE
ncbi:S-layer homology domain-containing protein [Anaerovirgula multivorans]|uniref:S-layer homology domain-containing protein n=1 Tax=Anaerovirgula multivorans TaxID=312168 RepID=A0A239C8Y8_9FIRM|nr:S-layer homology domain-containing protein [Anaerovirgula multivorans]SNS16352.1 S-layer homology domain-containing protein [Anaerovirgula multivorans]